MSKAVQPDGTDPFADNDRALTAAQAAAIRAWLEGTAPLIGLHGWRFYVSTQACKGDKVAESSVALNAYEMWMAVELGHPKVDEPRRRAIYTHELLHCHLTHLLQPLKRELEDRCAPGTWSTIRDLTQGHEERTIERIAWAISEYLPPCPSL